MTKLKGIQLNEKLVALLRWELPSSGIPYDTKNGTALVPSVAEFTRVTEMEIVMATDPVYGSDKLRMIVLKGQEERIGSLGGHDFSSHIFPVTSKLIQIGPES